MVTPKDFDSLLCAATAGRPCISGAVTSSRGPIGSRFDAGTTENPRCLLGGGFSWSQCPLVSGSVGEGRLVSPDRGSNAIRGRTSSPICCNAGAGDPRCMS
jgi:hypothetical protein